MLGQIAGAAIGGYFNNQAAKKAAGAQDRATAAQMQGYTDARPYIQDMYKGGQGALNDALAAGYYGGPTYAGLNDTQTGAVNNQIGMANTGFGDAQNFMNMGRGFGQNTQNLYNQASQDMLGNAVNYATNSDNYSGLVDSAMRDSRRNLNENTLRNIDMNAASSGNANSSRAGIAGAVAQRAFDDRQADVTSGIQSNLIDRSLNSQQSQLNNMTSANANLGNLYGTGFSQGASSNEQMLNAGGVLQKDLQNQYNNDRSNFEGNRDFAMNQYTNYNAGILNNAPQTSGQVTPNFIDPTMAGFGGAMAGYGMGGQLFGGGGYGSGQGGGYSYGAGNPGSFQQGSFSPTRMYNYGAM